MSEVWEKIPNNFLPAVISFNGTEYTVEEISKRTFELTTKGMMEAYFKGNKDYEWLRTLQEFYITARAKNENFSRTFVLDENSLKELLNSEQNDERSVATEAASSTDAGNKIVDKN